MVEGTTVPASARGTSFFTGRVSGLIAIALIVGAWWVASLLLARVTDRAEVLLPTPAEVIESIPRLSVFAGPQAKQTYLMGLQVLAENTLSSTVTLIGGLAIGSILGIGMGLALGWSSKLRCVFEAPLLVVRVIPLLALLPLFLSWFGGTQTGAISYVAFAVFSMLFVSTLEAIRNVDPLVQVYARTLGASPFRVYRTVVAPAIVPELLGGVRVVLGLGWAILLAAEFLAAQSGIGHIMILAQQYFDTSRMILIVMLIMILAYILDRAIVVMGNRLTRWAPKMGG
jgi:ABC-type nitrate/sulfonate/bicarbonate transport system permease component